MALIIPLADEYGGDSLWDALHSAPRHRRLRDAVPDVITAIHGLPMAMAAHLSQIEVYVGRSGASASHLRSRWSARFEAFERVPSVVALVAVRAPTALVQGERWERTAHLLLASLKRSGALCCSNATAGDVGRWPETEDCAIYVVARQRRGPARDRIRPSALNDAVAELLDNDDLDAHVVRAAAKEILHPERGTIHEVFAGNEGEGDEVGVAVDVSWCREGGCSYRAHAGNYGFCRKHRAYTPPGKSACRDCGRPALPSNYGFCGHHRR